MTAPPPGSWMELFTPPAAGGRQVNFDLRIVRRAGQPFLILPAASQCAAAALTLYPAQTLKARGARWLLALALRAGQAPGLEKISLSVSVEDAFIRFVTESAGRPAGDVPTFALLPGNPNAEGRRFVMLLFNSNNEPAVIIKAGVTPAARRLIAHEVNVLQSIPAHTPGVPAIKRHSASPQLEAFAMDFIPGRSPRAGDTDALAALFSSWIAVGHLVNFRELAVWERLLQASVNTPLPKAVESLGTARFHASLMHGDCAPWNVRVARGQWTLLDWERGERTGVPGWDWFHFVLQTAILVRRETVAQLFNRLERLLTSDAFLEYARRAGISGNERALALAYLSYCTRVIRQTEGADRVSALEETVRQRWFA